MKSMCLSCTGRVPPLSDLPCVGHGILADRIMLLTKGPAEVGRLTFLLLLSTI